MIMTTADTMNPTHAPTLEPTYDTMDNSLSPTMEPSEYQSGESTMTMNTSVHSSIQGEDYESAGFYYDVNNATYCMIFVKILMLLVTVIYVNY